MAFVNPGDAEVGEAQCGAGKHHWHMTDATSIKCCRCDATDTYTIQEREGANADKGDAPAK